MRAAAASAASAGSTPEATWASRQASPLRRVNSRPSSEAFHAATSAGSTLAPEPRCRARPISARSQPIPTAPGPNWAQSPSSTWAMCVSANRVRASPSAENRTSIQLTWPPNSHVASNPWGGSHRSIVPSAFPSSL